MPELANVFFKIKIWKLVWYAVDLSMHHEVDTLKSIYKSQGLKQPCYIWLTGNPASSIHSACQKVDSGEVIGTGVNHILTPNHKDMRKEVFAHLHDNLMEYLPKEEEAEPLE